MKDRIEEEVNVNRDHPFLCSPLPITNLLDTYCVLDSLSCWGSKNKLDLVAFPKSPSPVKYGVCGGGHSYLGFFFLLIISEFVKPHSV